jgi:hypothetical protein
MIKMTIEIASVPAGTTGINEFGVGVKVNTIMIPNDTLDGEGTTFAGICLAINDYMHSRGAPAFDCLKMLR